MGKATDYQDRAKRFIIFKNGDTKCSGREFVLNRRRVRNWDSFLQQVTNDIKSVEAVRSLRTPVGGTKVRELEALEDSKNYVAVGNGAFKKVNYVQTDENAAKKTRKKAYDIDTVRALRPKVSGRIKKVPTDVVTVFVYANGKVLEPARRITLTHAMLRNWERVLHQVNDKIRLNSGATRRLCTLDGKIIADPVSLEPSGYYVAVGAEIGGFKKLNYGSQRPAFNNFPKRKGKRFESIMGFQEARKQCENEQQHHARVTIMSPRNAAEQNKNSNNHAAILMDQRDRKQNCVFYAKPAKYKRAVKKQMNKDESGVFKAKGRYLATQDAEEIADTKDTQVDLPIDQVEAEEVQEEDLVHAEEATISSNQELTKMPSDSSQSGPPSQQPRTREHKDPEFEMLRENQEPLQQLAQVKAPELSQNDDNDDDQRQ